MIGVHQHVLIEAAFDLTPQDTGCLTLWLSSSGPLATARLASGGARVAAYYFASNCLQPQTVI